MGRKRMSKRQRARTMFVRGDYASAAATFAELSAQYPDDLDLYLQTARSYREAGMIDEAATWYYKIAQIYADMGIGVQSVALLRIYRDLRPDDIESCRRMFRQCRTQTNNPKELLDMLSEDDQACYSMHYSDIFSVLDDASFDSLLDDIEVRELKLGERLARAGDPADSLFLIAEGAVQVWMPQGEELISLGQIGSGGVCGEVQLFTGGQRRASDLVACLPSRIIEVSYALLNRLHRQNEAIGKRIDELYRRHLLERQIAITPFFCDLKPKLRQKIAAEMEIIGMQADEILFREGDHSQDLYMVCSGTLSVYVHAQGTEKLIKTLQAGATVGEVSVLVRNGRRSATVRAATPCTLMRWRSEDYKRSYAEDPQLQQTVASRMVFQRKTHALAQEPGMYVSEGDESGAALTMDMKAKRKTLP